MIIYKGFSHSAMLCSSLFIVYSVSGLFLPFVKDPSEKIIGIHNKFKDSTGL